MNAVPWYAYSPSPFTLAFWGAMGLYGAWKLGWLSRGWRYLCGNIADSAWMLGIIVLGFDFCWCIGQMKFFFLDQVLLLHMGLDASLALFAYMMLVRSPRFNDPIWKKLRDRVNNVGDIACSTNSTELFLTLLAGYMVVWFWFAPSPSWTDWTYAIRVGDPFIQVAQSFLISHIGAKSIQGLIFWSLWRK